MVILNKLHTGAVKSRASQHVFTLSQQMINDDMEIFLWRQQCSIKHESCSTIQHLNVHLYDSFRIFDDALFEWLRQLSQVLLLNKNFKNRVLNFHVHWRRK